MLPAQFAAELPLCEAGPLPQLSDPAPNPALLTLNACAPILGICGVCA